MTSAKWLSPRKLREYHIDYVVPDVREASKQLFLAVAGGEVRARCQGIILDPRWFSGTDDSDPFALPPDVELSVEDAQQKWASRRSIP
jgi:hypothetical protein